MGTSGDLHVDMSGALCRFWPTARCHSSMATPDAEGSGASGIRVIPAHDEKATTMAAVMMKAGSEAETEIDTGRTRPPTADLLGNVVRGGLIGAAETIPGVSGGTVALVTGIYHRMIASAKHLTDVPRTMVGKSDWRASLRQVDWWLLLPVAAGMVIAVFALAGLMESFVSDQPIYSRALFMGMIAMSVAVPFIEIERGALRSTRAKSRAFVLFVLSAAAVFALTSLPRREFDDPPLLIVAAAAAIAVCALVLPGVSGSFFLLVVGLYAPTMAAIDDRNLQYLAVFAIGALIGLVTFVRVLEWLLERHHTAAMVAAGGLLLGSLRALWPWQTDTGGLLGVGDGWPLALVLFLVGAAVVGVVALVQRKAYAADARASVDAAS
jgi:putative membrane protein